MSPHRGRSLIKVRLCENIPQALSVQKLHERRIVRVPLLPTPRNSDNVIIGPMGHEKDIGMDEVRSHLKNTATMVLRTPGIIVTHTKALDYAAMAGDLPSFSMKENYTSISWKTQKWNLIYDDTFTAQKSA